MQTPERTMKRGRRFARRKLVNDGGAVKAMAMVEKGCPGRRGRSPVYERPSRMHRGVLRERGAMRRYGDRYERCSAVACSDDTFHLELRWRMIASKLPVWWMIGRQMMVSQARCRFRVCRVSARRQAAVNGPTIRRQLPRNSGTGLLSSAQNAPPGFSGVLGRGLCRIESVALSKWHYPTVLGSKVIMYHI